MRVRVFRVCVGDQTSKSVELWCPSQCSDIRPEQLRVKNKGVLSTTSSGFLRATHSQQPGRQHHLEKWQRQHQFRSQQ
ncbi:hypothetical protein TNCV_3435851 [Trichonephila clavipes]|nr:hypothetical protein TNCV_3435851 [Trichonephila clavipes]